jgi:subtilisin family serine protease
MIVGLALISVGTHAGVTRGSGGIPPLAAPGVGTTGRSVDGEILVTFKPGTSRDVMSRAHQAVGAIEASVIQQLGVRRLLVAPSARDNALAAYATNPDVVSAEPNYIADSASVAPNDPYFPSGSGALLGGQWGHVVTHAPEAWEATTGSPSVVIAVIDSGIDAAHPDLAGQTVTGTSVIGGTTTDTHGHGETVAGVIAPKTNNGQGGAGYCWNCRLMPVKVSNSSTTAYSDMAAGIVWAADHDARVINVSLGGASRSAALDSAVSYAVSRGAVVVAAAGNSGCNCATYPAASPGAIAVAASDQNDNLMNYSNQGSWVHVAAPTGDITTWLTYNGQPYGYAPVGGTSISAPVVSGIVALMLSVDPAATPDKIKSVLFSSTDAISGRTQAGGQATVAYGRVNALRALSAMAAGVSSPQPTSSPEPTATPLPTPTATPTPSPTATPTPVGSPTPQATTFTGSLNKKSSARIFSVEVGSGLAQARLSFAKCATLDLQLVAPGARTVASTSGPSVVALDRVVDGGRYDYRVSGAGQCSFTLTVTALPKS